LVRVWVSVRVRRPVGATLHVYGVRLAERPVSRQLERRAVDEGAVREDDLVRVRGKG